MNSQFLRKKNRFHVGAIVFSTLGVLTACGGRAEHHPGGEEQLTPSTNEANGTAGALNVAGASSTIAGSAGATSVQPPTTTRAAPTCTSPQAIRYGADTGFVGCKEGYVHRPSAVACTYRPRDYPQPSPSSEKPPGSAGAASVPRDECQRDSDCPGAHAYCDRAFDYQFDVAYLTCRNGCATDADCLERQICRCGEVTGTCERADCDTDASCGPGQLCVGTNPLPNCGSETFACSKAEDECTGNAQCTDPAKPICHEASDGVPGEDFRHCGQLIYCD